MHRFLLGVALLSSPLQAQGVPDTDIFVAPLSMTGAQMTIGTPVNVTHRPGYDNQPWFLPDGRSMLYVARLDRQTDVFRYDFASLRSVRITNTPESEYSPTLDSTGRVMLVIRVERDSSQHLWEFSAAGMPLRRAPGDVAHVGYYVVANDHTLALFLADSVRSVVLSDTRTGIVTPVARSLAGATPRLIPGEQAISFAQQVGRDTVMLKRLNLRTHAITPIVRAISIAGHHTWTTHGTLLMARGSILYEYDPKRGGDWQPVHDFAAVGMHNITRIALSDAGDRIALVAEQ